MRKLFLIALLSCGLLCVPNLAFGQGALGAITGSVLDSSGASIPDATLTITNVNTGVVTTVKSSTAGYYRVPLPVGTYRVEATKQGFQSFLASNILVSVEQVVTLNLTLPVGSTTQTVTVTEQAPLLTPSTAEVGASINPQELETLPIEVSDGGRQLQHFIFSSLPGAVGDEFSGSINGGQEFSSEILIDGISIARYDLNGGSLVEFSPSQDSIGEFKVQEANYSAEYGETGGGIANFVMKSGTNQFHGSAYEYLKNPSLNAAGLIANAFGTPKRGDKENNFGATFGGPIKRDKTFFFANYEGDRFRNFAYSGTMTLPTSAMKQGDFSAWLGKQLGSDALGRPVFTNEIYDPTTTRSVAAGATDQVTGLVNNSGKSAVIRDPFMFNGQLNVVNPAEFSKASSVLLPLFPNPLFSGLTRNTPSFTGCCPVLRQDKFSVKIDHVINDKQKLTGSINWNRRDRFNRNGRTFPPFPGQPLSPYKEQIVGGPQLRLSDNWTINDHTLNELALGYNRFNNVNNVTNNRKFTPQLGIPGIPNTCFPPFHFSGHVGQLPSTLGVGCENIDPSESYLYQDTLSYVRGKHSFKFGGEYRHFRYNTFEPGPLSGDFRFNDRETSLPGFTSKTGHPFASFMLGAVHSGSESIYTTEPGYRAGMFAFFAQDDFKATSRLTLNIGVRWEIPLPKKEAFNRQSGFDPTVPNPAADNIRGALVFLGSCSTCIHRTSFQDAYFKEVAPRFGVAYQATHNLVLRGGYGISFGPPILNNFGSQNLTGFNSAVPLTTGTSATGFVADPVTYWSPLASAALPAKAQVGVPPFTGTLPTRDPSAANAVGLDFLPAKSLAQPYVQNWSAGFQLLLPRQVLLEANYVGSKGTRLLDSNFAPFFNQAPSKYMGLGDILADDLATDLADPVNGPILASYGITGLPYPSFESDNFGLGTTVAQALSPFPQYPGGLSPYGGLLNNYPTFGNSTYHSLQVMARKNSAHGLTFIAAYTLSKTLTDSDSALYYPSLVQDFYNRKIEKSIAAFDFPQVLKLTWIYELPFGHGKRWLSSAAGLDRLVSGWQLTAIQNYTSGDPLQVSSSLGSSINAGLRADIVSGVPLTVPLKGLDVVNGTPYLNPAAFADPPSSPVNSFPLRVGTSSRFLHHIRGPGHQSEDFGIVKNTRISETVDLQFRADAFNVFNRTGRGDPDTSLGDGLPAAGGSFGLITSPAHGARVVQLALRLNF